MGIRREEEEEKEDREQHSKGMVEELQVNQAGGHVRKQEVQREEEEGVQRWSVNRSKNVKVCRNEGGELDEER